MHRRGFWVRLAALLLGLGLVSGAENARAIDIPLPGERTFEIHGFYEMRLAFTGNDFPLNGVTFSQFRHVLSLEVETELLPEGWGPFDALNFYSRLVVTYECIYRRACGLFDSADSFGGEHRDLVRAPRSLKEPETPRFFLGAIPFLELKYVPGTLVPVHGRHLMNGRRYEDILNEAGDATNPNFLAALANLNNRSQLDAPVDEFAGANGLDAETRAGFFNSVYKSNLLTNARPRLGEARYRALQNKLNFREFLRLDVLFAKGVEERAQYRNLVAEAQRTGDTSLQVRADQLINTGTLHPDPNAVDCPNGCFDAAVPDLVRTRPDLNVFELLARGAAPDLLEMEFAAHQLHSTLLWIPYLATMGVDIEPFGYFGTEALDLANHYDVGLASDIRSVAPFPDAALFPSLTDLGRDAVPYLVGPDGVRNTTDDLPFLSAGLEVIPVESETHAPSGLPVSMAFKEAGGLIRYSEIAVIPTDDPTRPGQQALAEIYAVFRDQTGLTKGGCATLGASFDDATGVCTRDGADITAAALRRGCGQQFSNKDVGVNADGKCVRLNVDTNVTLASVVALGDLQFRPTGSTKEPPDLTDFQVIAERGGNTPPARPRQSSGGIYYDSPGVRELRLESHALVSSLDVAFTEDELAWGHGASEDEHEFREGFLEAEFLDSQLYVKGGKLIVVWGKTELFRNQDRNNPLDISNGIVTRLEESRIPQWGVSFTISPELLMRVGPFEDLRLEGLVIMDNFQPIDLGQCGESAIITLICFKSFGAYAHGLVGLGLAGEINPYHNESGLARWDYGVRLEGRFRRFTFALTDFWGWDDLPWIKVVNRYGRYNDALTGAPVTSYGGSCRVRTVEGLPAGPDGDPNTDGAGSVDNTVPSVGDCLLWETGASRDALRSPDAVAQLHTVNQTIFHTICTLTFDPDTGYCGVDRLNNPSQYSLITQAIGGNSIILPFLVQGIDRARSSRNPFKVFEFRERAGDALSQIGGGGDPGISLQEPQKTLLGCGKAYVAPCGLADGADYVLLFGNQGQARGAGDIAGGIDLMNADGAVITQELTVLKVGNPFNLIGTRQYQPEGPLSFAPGFNWNPAEFNPADPNQQGIFGVPNSSDPNVPATALLTPAEIIALPDLEKAKLQKRFLTDSWVEPMPWKIDEALLAQWGAVVFKIGNQDLFRPECDPAYPFRGRDCAPKIDTATGEIILHGYDPDGNPTFDLAGGALPDELRQSPYDPTLAEYDPVTGEKGAPINAFNEIDGVNIGEYCGPILRAGKRRELDPVTGRPIENDRAKNPDGLFDISRCTDLEKISYNLERIVIAGEIVGFDKVFDPPESLAELLANLSDNVDREPFGDPIAGPDAIFTRNKAVFNTVQHDVQVVEAIEGFLLRAGLVRPLDVTGDPTTAFTEAFFDAFNPNDPNMCTRDICYLETLRVDERPPGSGPAGAILKQVARLPVAHKVDVVDANGVRTGTTKVSLLEMSLDREGKAGMFELGQLFAGEIAELPDGTRVKLLERDRNNLFGKGEGDLDGDNIPELDADRDKVWDGLDDFTSGPVTDDNLLCGSGLPGDPLQEPAQYESYRTDEAPGGSAFDAVLPNGLPPRSPVFCSAIFGLATVAAPSFPLVKAGGDGRYGRRDFLWQSGAQIALDYQKRNVVGFGLDFAEDLTKTSWGVEASWIAKYNFFDRNAYDLVATSDEYVLTVSVDRPTFFNYLNPNRTLFLNLQIFVRYVPDFVGGRHDKDGMFGSYEGRFSGLGVFTIFTGFFQDRLIAISSFIYEPTVNHGGVVARIQYRWTENFSTQFGVINFFGKPVQARIPIYGIGPRLSPDITEEALGRLFNPVRNQDSLSVNFRYTF